jgi:serine O-acetyltransferase
MISTTEELRLYLEADRRALKKQYKNPRWFDDDIWRFEIYLRKTEYYTNVSQQKDAGHYFFNYLYKYLFLKMGIKLGFSIPRNVFGPGLSIAHYGTIVVNAHAQIGSHCRIHEGVTIGSDKGTQDAPRIGDRVFIGSGAKILGGIRIADDIAIGANSVVTKSFTTPNVTIAGVPAKVISEKGSRAYMGSEKYSADDAD